MNSSKAKVRLRQKQIVTGICIVVGGLHFVTGSNYNGPLTTFVNGYLIDILLPFAMYLLLGVQNVRQFHGKMMRFFLVFGVGAVSETLQYFGVEIFGRTFDPLDYLMFVVGIIGAGLFERAVLSQLARAKTS